MRVNIARRASSAALKRVAMIDMPLATPRSAAVRPSVSGALIVWLRCVAALVVAIVVVGGITRLTESGLSITEWNPVTGALPPLNRADWLHEFALYQGTTEYRTFNRSMTLAEFKGIFFWEWAHRLLGRIIGLAFAVPLAWFAWRRAIPRGYGWRLGALLALGALQGAIGWWMVTSGLVGRTDVSHYRLAVHLLTALTLLGGLVWTAADLAALRRDPGARPARLTRFAAAMLALFAVQLLWGAFTAGLDAGHASADWPMMSPAGFVPTIASGGMSGLIDNPAWVQFIHRWWAWIAAGALVALAVRAMRRGARTSALATKVLIVAQIALGIATVVSGVDLRIAVAHQLVAALLVWTASGCAHALGSPTVSRYPPENPRTA